MKISLPWRAGTAAGLVVAVALATAAGGMARADRGRAGRAHPQAGWARPSAGGARPVLVLDLNGQRYRMTAGGRPRTPGPARPHAGGRRSGRPGEARSQSTVTVTGKNLAGRPDNGDPVAVVNVDQARRFDSLGSVGFFQHGVASFTVPDGHYWAFAVYFTGSAARLVTVPQFTVSGATTVHTAARMATSKVTVVTPRPAVLREVTTEMLRSSGTGPPSSQAATLEGGGAVYVSPVRQHPTVGSIRLLTSDIFGSPRGTRVPYQYAVSYAGPPGTIPAAERYRVRAGDLATVNESYYQSSASGGWWRVVTSQQAANTGTGPWNFPITTPGRDVLYVGGNVRGLTWQTGYWAVSPSGANDGGQMQGYVLAPGRHRAGTLAGTWNRYPLHPAANVVLAPQPPQWGIQPTAARNQNTLRLDLTPFTDNQPGDLGTGFGRVAGSAVTGSYQIDANGKRIAGGNAVTAAGGAQDLSVPASLGSGSPLVRVSLSASRQGPGFGLATASHTVWTWRSARGPSAKLPPGWYCWINPATGHRYNRCTVQPMMTLGYDVAGLGPAESAPPGRQAVTVTAGHLQLARAARVAGAKVWASSDGGRTWHAARVTPLGRGRFLATFSAPANATVALRTTATDASGGSISETITGAYRTLPR